MSQVVVIFGASGGLGSAIARGYAERGARLVLVGRRLDRLQALAASLPTPSLTLAADVRDAAEVERIAQHSLETYGQIDVVVNASGYDVRAAFLAHTPDETRQLIDTNLMGAISISRAFLPAMLAHKAGVVVHLGGFADGRLAFPFYAVDVATRAGLRGFVDALNREYEGLGVTIIYFCPAPADTDAERPYHPIWREMGTAIVPPESVAQALMTAVEQRQRVAIMGWTTRLFACLNSLSSRAADLLLMRHYRGILQRYFAAEG